MKRNGISQEKKEYFGLPTKSLQNTLTVSQVSKGEQIHLLEKFSTSSFKINAALPFGLGKGITDDLVYTQAFIRNDQTHSFETFFFQGTQEIAPGFLIFPAAFRNTKNYGESLIIQLVVSSSRRTNTPARYISIKASLTLPVWTTEALFIFAREENRFGKRSFSPRTSFFS